MNTVREKITGSRQALEKRLGVPIQHFAYPDGRFNRAVVAAVAAPGYRFGYTTCLHRDSAGPSLTIPRIVFWENFCLGRGSRLRFRHGVQAGSRRPAHLPGVGTSVRALVTR
jgi:peptidoglycan/xylan/chitin deacetylase (PgdA/CDA1 family)